jgi:hypothetical protein
VSFELKVSSLVMTMVGRGYWSALSPPVNYRAKPDPRMKRRPYTEEDAKHILEAARRENEAHLP